MRFGRKRYALALASLVPLGVYVASGYRDVFFWDVGEMDTVPWIAGIAHPTGFPIYVMLGWLWTHALPIGSVAFRMSLLSAVAMCLVAGLIAWTIARAFDAPWIGMAAAWLFAFGNVAWTRSTRAEVHSVALLAIVATIAFALEWYRTRSNRAFFGAAVAWGIGLAVHPVASLILPGLVTLLIARARDVRWRMLVAATGLVAGIMLAAYAYLPLRSLYVSTHALDPTLALGAPAGRPFWDYDHPSTLAGFRRQVLGSDFDVKQGLRTIVAPAVFLQIGREYLQVLTNEFTWLGVLIALGGVIVALARDRWRAIGMCLCGFACIPFALGYPAEGDTNRYFLTSFVIATLFAGEAGAWFAAGSRPLRILVPVAFALTAAWQVWSQRVIFSAPYDERARHVIEMVQTQTPANAILITNWTYGTPLVYAAYVENSLGGRTVDAVWLQDDASLVPRWLQSRPVFVVGNTYGSVPGFRLQKIAAPVQLYRIVRD